MTDSTELAEYEEARTDLAPTNALSSTAAMLSMMRELALNPDIDATKLEVIARVANEQQDRAARQEFFAAKAEAVRAMPVIRKDGRIVIAGKGGEPDRVQGHFEKWPDVQRAITPHLQANRLTLTHRVNHTSTGETVVTAILTHDNGYQEESGEMRLPTDSSGGKNNVQGAGSAQSYGMRYSTRAILGLQFAPGDDDGNLIALPDEPLNDQQERRVAEATALFAADPQQFEDWWRKLQPQDKAWMVQTGRYAEITGTRVLPGTQRIADQADARDREESGQSDNQPRQTTDEAWIEKYVGYCRSADTKAALDELKRKGEARIRRINQAGKEELVLRATEAEDAAYDRINEGSN